MKLSTKILTVAFVVAMVLTITTVVSAAGFNSNLTIGSTGADVTALQTTLVSGGYLTMPAGVSMGYFGGLTKAAVVKFQAANGVPATGFVGPLTRGVLNGAAPVVSAGNLCPNGMTLASNCTLAPNEQAVAVCPNGMTLASNCSVAPGRAVSTNNVEGSIALQSAPVSVLTSVASGDSKDSIMAFGVKATGSNVAINRVNVSLHSSTTALPWSYFSTLYLYSGSTLVGSVPVNSNTLTQNTFGLDYTASFGGLNVNIPVETTGNFTVKADIVNTIPGSPATYAVGLNDISTSNAIRGTDGLGLSQYISSTSVYNQTISFSNTGNGNVTVTTDNANPIGNNVVENSNQTVSGVTALVFDIKNTTNSAVTVQSITATINNVPSVSAYYLYNGSNQIQSLGNPNSTTLAFNNFTPFTIPANTTSALSIKFDASANASGTVSVSIPTASSQVAVINNSNLVTPTGSATGNNFVLVGTAGVAVNLVGSPTFNFVSNTQGVTGYSTGTFQFQVSPVGVSLNDLSKSGALTVVGGLASANAGQVTNANGTYATDGTYLASTTPSVNYTVSPVLTNGISDGNTAVITVTVNRTNAGAGTVSYTIAGFRFAKSSWTVGQALTTSNSVAVTSGLQNATVTGYANN